MVKCTNIVLGLVLALAAITTVTSFGDDNTVGRFGGGTDYNRKYQSWQDKRGFTRGPIYKGLGRLLPPGDLRRFYDWRQLLSSAMSKRQLLHFGPRSFGSYRHYFSNDGLQDWRSSYTAGKRTPGLLEDDLDV